MSQEIHEQNAESIDYSQQNLIKSTSNNMKKSLETICIHGGWKPTKGEPQQLPIYQSTTFKYDTSEQMARLFDLKDSGYFYTRLANPTNDAVAKKIAALEGEVLAQYSPLRDKRPTSMLCLIFVRQVTTSLHLIRFMAEPLICLE